MNLATSLAAAVALALASPAISQSKLEAAPAPLPPDTELVVDGKVRVDAADFEGSILRIPEDRRGAFRMSHERVASVIDGVFVTRSVAQKARDAGMDRDPAVQARLKQLQDAFLADLYMKKLDKTADDPGLEKRAREFYIADPQLYMTDEEVQVQQILVGTKCRTLDAARERAQLAYTEVRDGKQDILAASARYTDEGDKVGDKTGDLGWSSVKKFVPSVREALATLKNGEISPPVESQFGFHILKLVDRKPPRPKTFDQVKQQILAAERSKVQSKRLEDVVSSVRNSNTVITHRENIGRLVAPGINLDELSRRGREAHSKATEPSEPKTEATFELATPPASGGATPR